MLISDKITEQLNNTLEETDFGSKYKGKVRDCYAKGDNIIMITTDRISAFDVVLGTIPFKGQVLNQLAVYWFNQTKDIVANHIVDIPDPNVMVVKRCAPLKVEMIVRSYIAGSLWRDYESGKKVYGLDFPPGLKKNQRFDTPIITPSTKAEQGLHDEPISRQEILSNGIVEKELYEKMEKISIQLFKRGTELAFRQGLILVDTKYEFGLDPDGSLTLMDEIHTPDSSRYWVAKDYENNFHSGNEQNQLSKEFLREWLLNQGFKGDGIPPPLTDEIKVQVAQRYIEVYEHITGKDFIAEPGNVEERVRNNIKKYLY